MNSGSLRHRSILAFGLALIALLLIAAISYFHAATNATTPAEQPHEIKKPLLSADPKRHNAPGKTESAPFPPTPTHEAQDENIKSLTFQLDDSLHPWAAETAQQNQPLPAPQGCFMIRRFVLEVPENLPANVRSAGANLLPLDNFHFLRETLNLHTGTCIEHEKLEQLLQQLTALILEKGYTTTRLGIPQQNLSDGTLKISLMPGLIHSIRFKPAHARATWKTAFPARPGQLLNVRDLEQGLEQMKRVPSQDVAMQIKPADSPGESDVDIEIKQARSWKWIATLDDSGAKDTGKYQGSLSLSVDNLLGINDLFNAGFNNDAGNRGGNRGTRGNNAYYSMPFGNWTFSLSGSNYQYHQRIAGNYQTFISSGESSNLELKMSYMLDRSQYGKSTLQFRTAKSWSKSFVDDTEIAVQSRNTTLAEIALTHKHNIANAQLETTLAHRAGQHWFGAQDDLTGRLPGDPTFFYEMTVLDTSLNIPFSIGSHPCKLNHTLHAQSSPSPLYATYFISIGNRWSVRGFDGETTLAAERGWYIRNEFETPIAGSNHSLYLGLDAGQVYGNNVPNLLGDRLIGTVLGLRGSFFSGMFYDVFAGRPVYKPEKFPTADIAAGFSLTYQF